MNSRWRWWQGGGLFGALLAYGVTWSAPVAAQVFQRDADQTPLPQPVGMNEWQLVTENWAYQRSTRVTYDPFGADVYAEGLTFGDFHPEFEDGDAITLEGLFKWRGETIDPVLDARSGPGYFETTCGFNAELVLWGGSCTASFGWYNVPDPGSTTPPLRSEIYELVPSNHAEEMDCQSPIDTLFCPLAAVNVNPRSLHLTAWTPVTYSALDITNDARYQGGYVGFAMIGNQEEECSGNKHSMPGQNQRNINGDPWITALQYRSTVNPSGYYLAFEDLPMSETDWRQTGIPGSVSRNDGDFNDLVFYISGAECDLCLGDCDDPGNTGFGGSAGNGTGGNGASGGASGTDTGGAGGSSGNGGNATGSGGDSTGGEGGVSVESGGGGTVGEAGSPGDRVCIPGRQLECSCVDGRKGAQICNEEADGYSACECSSGTSKGCGCRLTGAPNEGPRTPWLALALIGALAVRRRRP